MADDAKKKKTAKKSGGEVMAKLRAEKAKKKAKASNRLKTPVGRKGAEKPDENEAFEQHEAQLRDNAASVKGMQKAAHFADSPAGRISGHAAARGRKTQARRDQKG